jgi:putative membrane protein
VNPGVFIPYCGSPPVPGNLSWNFGPILLISLSIGFANYLLRSGGLPGQPERRGLFVGALGWVVLFAAFVTPICNLSVALFAARTTQHLLVTLVAAPLLIVGGFDRLFLSERPSSNERVYAAISFALVLWFWHMPKFYDETLRNNFVYWAMHITLAIAALWLWRALLRGDAGLGTRLVVSLATGAQTCALGALLTLSPRPWFAVHQATTWPWGLSQIADQQLGGAIMWIVGGTILGGLTVAVFARDFVGPRPGAAAPASVA